MTTILWHKNHLYADSKFFKGNEVFHALNKIVALKQPTVIVAKDHGIDDRILGYVASGSTPAVEGLIAHLTRVVPGLDFQPRIHFYELVCRSGLIVQENTFEVLLFGEKAIYSLRAEPDNFIVKTYSLDETVGMGSGGELAVEFTMQGYRGIRAMYGTILADPCSGGMIDCWTFIRQRGSKTPRFVRKCVFPALSVPQMYELMSQGKNDPVVPTMSGLEHVLTFMEADKAVVPKPPATKAKAKTKSSKTKSKKPLYTKQQAVLKAARRKLSSTAVKRTTRHGK